MVLQTASFKIRKGTLDVELCDAYGRVRPVQVYLTEAVLPSGRFERLQDVLGSRRFVPLRADGRLELLSVRQVAWLKVDMLSALDELDPMVEQAEGTLSAEVQIEMCQGPYLEGTVRYLLPPTRRRLGDYLEVAPEWFPLRTEDWLYLVSREHVLRVFVLAEELHG